MEKPSTINVVDDGQQLQRDIIKTHLYYLENVNILNDQERGYFYREYFPYVKAYFLEPLDQLAPFVEDPDEVEKVFTGKSKRTVPEPDKRKIITEEFAFRRDDGQPKTLTLAYLPKVIVSVRVVKSKEYEARHVWWLEPLKNWTVNKSTGVIDFMQDINIPEIMDLLEINSDFYIFVDYVPAKLSGYEVGEDGES